MLVYEMKVVKLIMLVFKAAAGGFLSRGRKFEPLDVKRVYFGALTR